MVAAILHPDGIDPQALPLLLTLATHLGENIRPVLPQLCGEIHIVLAASHVAVPFLRAGTQGEAIELPIIEIKPLHEIEEQLFDALLIDWGRHANIFGFRISKAVPRLLDMLCKPRRIHGIAAARAEPEAKMRGKFFGKRRAGIQLLRELFIKAPKALAVIIPSIIHHIGVHGGHAVLR